MCFDLCWVKLSKLPHPGWGSCLVSLPTGRGQSGAQSVARHSYPVPAPNATGTTHWKTPSVLGGAWSTHIHNNDDINLQNYKCSINISMFKNIQTHIYLNVKPTFSVRVINWTNKQTRCAEQTNCSRGVLISQSCYLSSSYKNTNTFN